MSTLGPIHPRVHAKACELLGRPVKDDQGFLTPLTTQDMLDALALERAEIRRERVERAAVKCECLVTPESMWLSAASCGYGSGYEPGSQMEWNPDCPVHRP